MKLFQPLVHAALITAALSGTVQASSLDNLERGRANLINAITDTELNAGERATKISTLQQRLWDLELQVTRDRSLRGKHTPHVTRIFQSYEDSFLVHAARERGKGVVAHWFERIGLTADAIRSARVGNR